MSLADGANRGEMAPSGGGAAKRRANLLCGALSVKITPAGVEFHRCTRQYSHKSSLYRHRENHWLDTCSSCFAAVPTAKMEAHSAECTGWKKCVFCDATFSCPNQHLAHVTNCHPDPVSRIIDARTRPHGIENGRPVRVVGAAKLFRCDECGYSFTRKDNLLRHRRNMCRLPPGMDTCLHCNKKFRFRRHLAYHISKSCIEDEPV